MTPLSPVERLVSYPLGTRVVVRYRIPGGFTDALGYLNARTNVECTVVTKRGPIEVPLTEVVAAKRVPPPPSPRERPSSIR